MTIGVLLSMTIAGTTLIVYTSSNARSASTSKVDGMSFSLAEAGLANALSVLNLPSNDPLQPKLLPAGEATASTQPYEGGTAKWWGVLNRDTRVWTVTGLGIHSSPTGPGTGPVRRTLTARVPVTPIYTQEEENPAWNWIYARRTGNTCDMTVNNTINGSSRLYVVGNLCIHNAATISNGPLIVHGNLELTHKDATVGAPTSMTTRVETYVGGNCRNQAGAWAIPCTGDQDSRKIYSKWDPPGDPATFVTGVNNVAPVIPEPAADFVRWYEHGIPGPAQSCTTTSGTPPVFDTNYPIRDGLVPTFELTPATSYTCRIGPADTPSGEISWNATTKTLKVIGTVYIDGSVRATNGQANSYDGFGSLYVSGTFVIDAGTKLCAQVSGSTCDFANWDPNAEMLTVAANGSDASSNGVVVNANSAFQGALYATQNIYLNNNVKVDGPVIGNTVIINNGVTTDAFPTVQTVPAGMPGDETIYAQPNPPELFSG
jgi:hypothetical protein